MRTTSRQHQHKERRERGTVLLLALLIMSTVVLSASGLSSLILNSLQQTRIVDSSIIAFYAAESGVEEALYAHHIGELTVPSTDTGSLSNGATWDREVLNTETVVYANIVENDFIEIGLYDPAAQLTATDIAVVRVDWVDDCTGCTSMQASVVGWEPGGVLTWETGHETLTQRSTVSPLWFTLTDPGKLYKLRLKALNGDVESVEIRAFDDSVPALPVPIPGRLRINANGNYVDAQQRISATLPQEAPALGLFDYVIYSECSIVKGGPAICSNPTTAP